MWIGARILVVLGALLARWRLRRRVVVPAGRTWGVAYSINNEKHGADARTTIGVPLESRAIFRIGPEDRYARLFRWFGLTPEMRTGDKTFDERFTVVADHRFVGQLLRAERSIRHALLALDRDGAESVYGDGRILWIRFAQKTAADRHLPDLVALKRMLAPLEKSVPNRFADVTLWKAFTVEALLFGSLAYGVVSSVFEWLDLAGVYLRPNALMMPAVGVGLALMATLFAATYLLTWRTPRARSLRLEAAVMSVLIVPITGYPLASQINRGMDRTAPLVVTAEVSRKERPGEGGKFYLQLKKFRAPASLEAPLPTRVEVPPGLYRRVKNGGKVKFFIGEGRLGAEWVRALRTP